MKKTFPELPLWEFEIDEVSAGFYEVIGTSSLGHHVSSKGIDPDSLVEQCRLAALNFSARPSKKPSPSNG